MKKGTIYDYHVELQNWKRQGTVLEIFFGPHIMAFYQEYGDVINQVEREILDLRKKVYQHDPEGRVLVGADQQPILMDGITREEANRLLTELFEQPLPMKLHKATAPLKKIIQ